ncbi:MAG: tetratricopeptide repeat protein [Bacteroidales bacterium]
MKTNQDFSFVSYQEVENDIDRILQDTEKQDFILALKSVHAEYMTKERKMRSLVSNKKGMRNIYLAVAASVVLLVGIIGVVRFTTITSGKNYEDIFYKYYQAYPISYQNREAQQDNDENLVNMAIQAYENKEYYKAITLFSNIETSISDCTLMAAFYKGVSCIEVSDYKNAIQSFTRVINAPYNTYTANAHWYMALTWLKLNNVNESVKHLDWLVKNDRQLNTKAEEILSALEK